MGNPKKQKVYSLFISDHKHKITVPASHSAKSTNNNNNNDDDDVSNMKQYSRIGHTHNNLNSIRNSNSNSNNKNIKGIDARITEIDQSHQNSDNSTGQGIVGKPKKSKVFLIFKTNPKQDTSVSISNSAKRVNNNNNNEEAENASNTKQFSRLVHKCNNYNSTSNSNTNNNNVKVIDTRIKEIDQSHQKVDNNTGQDIVRKPMEKKAVSVSNPAKEFNHIPTIMMMISLI